MTPLRRSSAVVLTVALLSGCDFSHALEACRAQGRCPVADGGSSTDGGSVDAAPVSPQLAWLTPSKGELAPAFDPATTTYTVVLPPGASSVALTPVAPGVAITVNAAEVSSAHASPEFPVGVAPLVVTVGLTGEGGGRASYTVIVKRSAHALKATNTGAHDSFGNSVALSQDGSTLAVGAFYEASNATGVGGDQTNDSASYAGAVYVFARVGSSWVQRAYLKAPNAGASDAFGTSVALSADGATLAVGAFAEDSASTGVNHDGANDDAQDSGAAYVFTSDTTGWHFQAYLKASNTKAFDYFGLCVTLSGDGSTLAVGSMGEDSAASGVNPSAPENVAATDSGAVYVFVRAGGSWSQKAYIKTTNPAPNDHFGYALALSTDGSTLVAGADNEDSDAVLVDGDQTNDNRSNSGAVYVFRRTGTTWAQEAYVKAPNPDVDDYFGSTVALSGDGATLAVGSYREDSRATGVGGAESNNDEPDSGAVYVYTRASGVWAFQAYIKASNTQAADAFSRSIALSGDGTTLAVGATQEDSRSTGIDGEQANNALESSGAVYLFVRSGSTWAQVAYLKGPAQATSAQDFFGSAVALTADGSSVVVGAPGEDSCSTGVDGAVNDDCTDSGAAYTY